MELGARRWDSQGEEIAKLVCLHGMGGTGKLWRPVAASLEDQISVLAPDQRGHGDSRIPRSSGSRAAPQYRPLDYGQDVVDTLERENFHPAWVLGHSMGVRTACATAHLKPDWVQGLILVDLGFSGMAGGGLGEDLASFLKKLPPQFESRAAAREFMAAECPDPSMAQYLMAVSEPASGGQGVVFPFDHAALIETIYSARDASVRTWVEEAGRRQLPVLVLRGATSQVWSAEELEQERAHFAPFPSIRFETWEGTGHGLPFEKRVEFVARIRQFIATGR